MMHISRGGGVGATKGLKSKDKQAIFLSFWSTNYIPWKVNLNVISCIK